MNTLQENEVDSMFMYYTTNYTRKTVQCLGSLFGENICDYRRDFWGVPPHGIIPVGICCTES